MTSATPTKCSRRGRELTLYFNTGTVGAPVWVEHLAIIGDLTISEVEDDEELETRSTTKLIKEYIEGNIDVNITGEQTVDEEYEGYLFLYSMRAGGSARDVMVITGPIDTDGVVGWRGKMFNKDRSITGGATGGMNATFSLRPAACTDTPVRPVKLASSTASDWDPTTYTPPA